MKEIMAQKKGDCFLYITLAVFLFTRKIREENYFLIKRNLRPRWSFLKACVERIPILSNIFCGFLKSFVFKVYVNALSVIRCHRQSVIMSG